MCTSTSCTRLRKKSFDENGVDITRCTYIAYDDNKMFLAFKVFWCFQHVAKVFKNISDKIKIIMITITNTPITILYFFLQHKHLYVSI